LQGMWVDIPPMSSCGPGGLQLTISFPLRESLGCDSEESGQIFWLDKPIIHRCMTSHIVSSLYY
jgi:hypothetical protein